MAGQFGDKDPIVFRIGPLDATSIAVSQDHFIIPTNARTQYRVDSIMHAQAVASSSGTFKLRAITGTSAPNAAPSATVRELLDSGVISTASTANTSVRAPLANVLLNPGDRIASTPSGVQTGLVGFIVVVTLVPVNNEV